MGYCNDCELTPCANDPECQPAKYCEECLEDATACAEAAGQGELLDAIVMFITQKGEDFPGYKAVFGKLASAVYEEFRPKTLDEIDGTPF